MFRGVLPLLQSVAVSQAKTLNTIKYNPFFMHGFLYLNGKASSMVYYFEALTRTSRMALILLCKMFEYVRRLVSKVLMNACAEMTTGFLTYHSF